MSAITTSNTALINRLLNDVAPDILKKLVQTHQTAEIAQQYGNVKKTLTFIVRKKDKRILRGFKADGVAKGDEFSYDSIDLEVKKFMAILDLTASEDKVEAFNAHLVSSGIVATDLSDDMYLTDLFLYLIAEAQEEIDGELEDADWQAIKVTSGGNAADDADAIHKFDGFRRLAATLATAGKGTIVTTGAITSANAMTKVEEFFVGFDTQIKRTGAIIFCSYALFDNYKIHYRAANSGRELGTTRLEGTNYEGAEIYLGGKKTMLMPVQGFGTDDALIGCRAKDMAIGYSMVGELDVQKRGFTIFGYLEMKYGVQFLQQIPGYLVVNDRLIAVEVTTPRTNA